MDLFLQWLDSVSQPMSSHTDSHQAFLLQEIDLAGQGSDLAELKWSQFFTPCSLELGESAYEWQEAGFMVLAIKPCSVPSQGEVFRGR
jgi:hypothetical protein